MHLSFLGTAIRTDEGQKTGRWTGVFSKALMIDNIGSRLIELEDALFILDKLIPTNSKLLWRPPAALLERLKSPAAILDNKPLEMHVRAWDSADDESAVQVQVFDEDVLPVHRESGPTRHAAAAHLVQDVADPERK